MKFTTLALLGVIFPTLANAQIYSGTRYHAPEMQSTYSNESAINRASQYNAPQYVPPPMPQYVAPTQYRNNYVSTLPTQHMCRVVNHIITCY